MVSQTHQDHRLTIFTFSARFISDGSLVMSEAMGAAAIGLGATGAECFISLPKCAGLVAVAKYLSRCGVAGCLNSFPPRCADLDENNHLGRRGKRCQVIRPFRVPHLAIVLNDPPTLCQVCAVHWWSIQIMHRFHT